MANNVFKVEHGLEVLNGANVATGNLSVVGAISGSNSMSITGNVTVSNTLAVTGNTTFSNSVAVTGNATFSNTIAISGLITASGGANVANLSVANAATFSNTLAVTGLTTASGGLNVTGTANATVGFNVGANVNLTTSQISVGNASVNTVITGSVISGNGANVTSVNAATVGGNSAATLRSYTDSVAATGYSNAIAFAANATNISFGTLDTARLPATANVATAINIGANVNLTTSRISVGNSVVNTVITSTAIDTDGTLAVLNAASFANTLSTGGKATLQSAEITTDLTINGNLITGANTILAISGTVNGSILPAINSLTLGNTANRWSFVYANTINATDGANIAGASVFGNTISVSGNAYFNASINVGTATINSTFYSQTANNANNLNGQPASFYTNATNISSGTLAGARMASATTLVQGAVIIVDSVSNTSITVVPVANSVKTAYDTAIAANTRAASAQTEAAAAYSNAIAYSANASVISSGTVSPARLPQANTTSNGAVILLDSVSNTSISIYAPTANAVKTAYDTAIAANTRAASAQTEASSAYSNAATFAANASNITSGTLNAARLPSVISVSVANVATINSTGLVVIGNTSFTNSVTIAGNLTVSGTTTYINTTSLSVGDNIITLNGDLPGDTSPTENAGFEVNRGSAANVSLLWNESSDIWQITTNGSTFLTVATNNDVSTAYSNAVSVAASDATTKAGTAYTNAISVAASDATSKAGTAYSNAVSVAASDATTKAGTAYSNAVSYAASIAGTAYSNAVSVASSDATTKAGTAYSNAVSYAGTIAATAYSNAVSVAASDATTKAGTAYSNATSFAANATNISTGTLAGARLGTSSNVQFNAVGVGTASGANGSIRATDDIVAFYSDERLKEKVGAIENALSKVKHLEGFRYRANDLAASFGYDQDRIHVGLSAQKVQEVLPEVIDLAPFDTIHENGMYKSISGEHYLTMHYDRVVALLVEAIKELDKKLEDHINTGKQ